ncbi:unnamed protein product [Schistocephalus solidus]|uniref:Secreted protein n=1 Tax=Schistocephalus solidus TaxID=70667 RepID=A0A183TBS4_SCHSO|nr:unnamed protein product [Schistocephalus solidus]
MVALTTIQVYFAIVINDRRLISTAVRHAVPRFSEEKQDLGGGGNCDVISWPAVPGSVSFSHTSYPALVASRQEIRPTSLVDGVNTPARLRHSTLLDI